MGNFRILRQLAVIALGASVVFAAGVAYLVVVAPGQLGYRTIFDSLRLLAQAGAVAGIASVIVFLLSLRTASGAAKLCAALATLLFIVPVATMIANEASPPAGAFINDITTDLDSPPAFSAVIPLREPGSNPIEYGGPDVAAVQRQVHPEVQPIFTNLGRTEAFQRAFETAEALGWEIVAGDPNTGIIEAIDTTTFFRFKDDIVIRISDDGSGSRIDLRSRSRVGLSDLGKNAARILEYSAAFDARN